MMNIVVVVLGIVTAQQQRSLPPSILGKLPSVSIRPHVSVSYDFAGSTTDASLVFATPTMAERHDVSLRSADVGALPPLRFSFERGDFVYFRAHNLHEAGSVSCEIRVNGDIISANTSYEPYGTARCEGKIPHE